MWEKGLFFILQALISAMRLLDWRFVSGEKWQKVYESLNGAGVESMQARFDEMFPPVVEEPKPEPSRRARRKKTDAPADEKKPARKPAASRQRKPRTQAGGSPTGG